MFRIQQVYYTAIILLVFIYIVQSCLHLVAQDVIKPLFVTDPVQYDSDDPAIWINKKDPAQSLIIGTDKSKDGALYIFNMEGKALQDKTVRNLQRPNNVDVAYGMFLDGNEVDIAVTTERLTSKLRIFSLPDMQEIDNGGISVFTGEPTTDFRAPMGIALYKKTESNEVYAIVSRKLGPTDGTYLWEYLLKDNGQGSITGTLIRKFGKFSGSGEIESIAVDNELGYIYYSDEKIGIRKYYADPIKGNEELAIIGINGFADGREGISIYKMENGTGYIIVSDQRSNMFRIFPREGTAGNPHNHPLLKVVSLAATQSDGSDVANFPISPNFPFGIFVTMSDDKTFQLYRWEDIAGNDLKIQPPPISPYVVNWNMDKDSGKTLADASGYGNDGIIKGKATWIQNGSGKALELNGVDQYVMIQNNPSLNVTGSITLAAWIKPKCKATQSIIKKGIKDLTDGYELSLSNTGKVFFRINQATSGDSFRINSKISYPVDGNTWMHIAACFDGKAVTLYINGNKDTALGLPASLLIKLNTDNLSIGAQSDGLYAYKGTIDEVRMANIAIPASEVMGKVHNYNNYKNQLIGNWKMDEVGGTLLIDSSNYQNNGSIIGNPTWITGSVNKGLLLDGTSQYVTVPDDISLNPVNAITLAAWIKPKVSNTQSIIKKAILDETDGYELSLSSAGKVFFRINQKTSGDTYRINSQVSYPTDGKTWMHVTATYDGVSMKLYINGILNSTLVPKTPPEISANTLPLCIGAQSDGTKVLNGTVDEARIYDTALSDAEIVRLATASTASSAIINRFSSKQKVTSSNQLLHK